jgi:purine-nucleoside phosphorylase
LRHHVIEDHIDLMFRKMPGEPVAADARTRSGQGTLPTDRHRGMHHHAGRPFYCRHLIEMALCTARRGDFAAYPGVYVAMTGPNYETRAEYRFLRRIGGDAVGMSTVPEVIAASRYGMSVLAVSVVTNVARPDTRAVVQPEEVVRAAASAEPKVRDLVLSCAGTLSED